MRKYTGGITAGLLTIAGAASGAQAASIANDIKVDSVYSGVVHIGRAYVPLPEGQWTVTSVNETRNTANNVLVEINLAAFMGRDLYGYISIGTNQEISGSGWTPYTFCDRTDIYFIQRDANQQYEQSCWGVNHFVWDRTSTYKPTFGSNIQAYLAERSIQMPGTTVLSQFHFANRSDYVNYFIYLNPTLAGFKDENGKWADSSWHKQLVKTDPAKIDYLERQKAQGAAIYAMLKDGGVYRDRSGGIPPMPPAAANPAGTNPAGTSVEQRLTRLKDLLDRNMINPTEYEEKRKKILDEL